MKVSVCVATYLRPQGLERLLHGLAALRFEHAPEPELEIVVVDNDPARSAAPVCEALAPAMPWRLRYVHEPRRGISHVRNRAVECAREGSDMFAFIDDDELPEPEWLDELLRVQAEYDADVVAGPVVRRFEDEPAPWVHRGRFFDLPRHATGARVEHPGAGNVLIRTAALDGMAEPFDLRFGLTGGEDTHLFLRLSRTQCTMVWADEAVAYEFIPGSRATAGWLLRRVYRSANTWSMCEREVTPGARPLAMRAAKGLARLGLGVALLPVSWVMGRHMMVRSLWYVCFGAGNLTGLAGLRYDEYRVTHGR
ncbi:MAG TPA: glycosyltransferase family 2 protein [Longimicrobium sp.]|jgi:glycosyltransferase involved in cell wall biosynthesis